ncbi:MBL fold metallo-hydrolase [Alicyclobacillus sp. ALC3]|uniref:MBL fold metallo-hydrolase n=1 Tax=Alicyclobacillus sp. ALC3 TaxID=2796143 RepID=UPI0023794BCC|nr:MBL fold metallo-hydrolase [Alicyclobacillus sp. ALC3]WDL97069.1 MBL fold metallo-hydrolase [Alicyclobacillus sp. ALC3]
MTVQKKTEIHRLELPTRLPIGTVNAYLVRAGGAQVLVDSGIHTEECRNLLAEQLTRLGVHPHDIDALVLTHGHVDHTGSTQWFRNYGVKVYAHPGVANWLDPDGDWARYRRAFDKQFFRQMGMSVEDIVYAERMLNFLAQLTDRSVVDVPLLPGQAFEQLPGFSVLYVPGHAQAAVALWNEQTGEFIGGDQVLPRISSNAVIEPQAGAPVGSEAVRTRSLIQYRENLQFLQSLPIETVYPGHGDPFQGANSLIASRLIEQERRRNELKDLLKSLGKSSAYALAVAYFPERTDQAPLILSEVVGYLDWMESLGAAVSHPDGDGVLRWQVAGE